MHRPSSRVVLLSLATVLTVAFSGALLRADAPSASPVAEIKDLMNAFNHKAYGFFGLVKATLKTEPQANDWKVAAYRATAMAECGNLLMGLTPPRGADDAAGKTTWATHAAAFRDCAKELAKQLKLKKLAEAQAQVAEVEKRCEECHTDHQLE